MTAIAAIVLVVVALAIITRPLFSRASGPRARAGGGLAEIEEGKLKMYHGGWTAYREAKGELPLALAHEQEAATSAA